MNKINLGQNLNHIVDLDLISDKSVIIDAGANVGQFITRMREFTDAKILSIEPSSRNCKIMKARDFKNVEIIEKAIVGTNSGPVVFTEYSGHKKAGGLHRYHQWSNIFGNHKNKFENDSTVIVNEYEVETTTLKALIDDYDIQSIDYLKMDLEGAEYGIFESLDQNIASKIKQISLEFHDESKNWIILEKLKELGFEYSLEPGNEIYAKKVT